MTVTSLTLTIWATFQVLLPEFFHARYGKDILWESVVRYSEHDSPPVKRYFADVDTQKFGRVPKKDILLYYICFGLDVVNLYVAIALVAVGAGFLLAAHGMGIYAIATSIGAFFGGWECHRHIAKTRWSLYSTKKRLSLKAPLLATIAALGVFSVILPN